MVSTGIVSGQDKLVGNGVFIGPCAASHTVLKCGKTVISLGWSQVAPRMGQARSQPPCLLISWVELVQTSCKSKRCCPPQYREQCVEVSCRSCFLGGCPVARTFGGSVPAVIPVAFLWPKLWKVTLGLYTWAIRFNGSRLHSLKAGYSPIRCPSLRCLRIALSAICKAIHIQYHLQILLKGCSGQMSAVNAGADEPGVFPPSAVATLCPFWHCFQVKHMCFWFKSLFRLHVTQTVLVPSPHYSHRRWVWTCCLTTALQS